METARKEMGRGLAEVDLAVRRRLASPPKPLRAWPRRGSAASTPGAVGAPPEFQLSAATSTMRTAGTDGSNHITPSPMSQPSQL